MTPHPVPRASTPEVFRMPQAKPIATYPKEYFTLFALAEKQGSHDVPDLSFKECESLKWDLYRFRKAGVRDDHPEALVWASFTLRPVQQEPEKEKCDSLWTLSVCNGSGTAIIGKIRDSLGSEPIEQESIAPDIFIDMGLDPTPIPDNPLADLYGANVLKRRGKDVEE